MFDFNNYVARKKKWKLSRSPSTTLKCDCNHASVLPHCDIRMACTYLIKQEVTLTK